MNKLRGAIRFFFFINISIFYMSRIVLANLILGKSMDRTLRIRRKCFSSFVKMLKVDIMTEGKIPDQKDPYIIISNHRSYFDPLTIMKDLLVLPVIKAEVSKWPIIGQGAEMSGVIFVNRKNRDSRKETSKKMRAILDKGYNLIIYPEGTTHVHPTSIDFKLGAFRVAAEKQIPVIATAIDYEERSSYWVGDDTFIPHFLSCFGKPQIKVKIIYSEAFQSDDPEKLMQMTKSWIDKKMLSLQSELATN